MSTKERVHVKVMKKLSTNMLKLHLLLLEAADVHFRKHWVMKKCSSSKNLLFMIHATFSSCFYYDVGFVYAWTIVDMKSTFNESFPLIW